MIAQFCKLVYINLNLSEDLCKKYFEREIQLWHTYILLYWKNKKEIPKIFLEAFEKCDSEIFSSFFFILKSFQ